MLDLFGNEVPEEKPTEVKEPITKEKEKNLGKPDIWAGHIRPYVAIKESSTFTTILHT